MATTAPGSPSVANSVGQPEAGSGQRYFNFAQLQGLWVQAGGNPKDAPLMAAIALSESGGDSHALNNNPSTGDYSVGLWQINYFDGLAASRTARYGPASILESDPLANAKAAVDLLGANQSGLSNWQGDAAYKVYQSQGISGVIAYGEQHGGHGGWTPYSGTGVTGPSNPLSGVPIAGSIFGAGQQVGAGAGNAVDQAGSTIHSIGDFVHEISNPYFWLRAAEVVGGILLVGLGLYLVAKDMGLPTPTPPGPAKGAVDEAAGAVRSLELQARAERAQASRESVTTRQEHTASMNRARVRDARARARASEAGAREAQRRSERARGITSSEIANLQMGQ